MWVVVIKLAVMSIAYYFFYWLAILIPSLSSSLLLLSEDDELEVFRLVPSYDRVYI